MAASSSGGRSDVWQRVDRKIDSSGAGSVAGAASASDSDGRDGGFVSAPSGVDGAQGDLPAGGVLPTGVDLESKDGDEEWISVVNRKGKKKLEDAAQGNLKNVKGSGRVFGHPKGYQGAKGADRRSTFRSGAVLNRDQKVFDRRAQRPVARVVINPNAEKRSWLDVCASRRKISSLLEMSLVSPLCEEDGLLIADVPDKLVDEAAGRWAHTLVGFVLGDVPFFGQILAWARRSWRVKQEVRVFSKENGFFYFQFGNEEDREAVLRNGPWLFDGRLVVLQRWRVNFGFDRDFLSSAPVWVRLPNLPLHLWSVKILSIITSVIGSPICLDRATASMERIAYARCLVEVNAKSPLVKFVTVRHEDGTRVRVDVVYEGEPPRCSACCCFGHTVVQCSAGALFSKKKDTVTAGVETAMDDGSLQGEAAGVLHEGKGIGVPLVEEEVLAASRSSSIAQGDVCNATMQDGDAEPKDSALGEQCNVKGDCCKETVDVAKSDAACNKSCDEDVATSSSSAVLLAAPSLIGECKEMECGRKQSGDSGAGISLSPVVDEIGLSCDFVGVDELSSYDAVPSLFDPVLSPVVNGKADLNLALAKGQIGQKGLDLVFGPEQSSPSVLIQSFGLNLMDSPPRIRLIPSPSVPGRSPPSEPVVPPPPEAGCSPPPGPHSPPPVPHSPPPVPHSPPLPTGCEVVGRGLNEVNVDSVTEGFDLGKLFLSGSKGDRDPPFEFTKINDAWLLEQEDAKQSNVKTKKSNPSLVGTRKSVRFGGGSGPTPPARFRK